MTPNMTAADLIDSFESCRLTAYWDPYGKCWTIGWGHTGKDVYEGLVWTQAQADEARDHDIVAADALISIYSPGLTGGPLEAITDFVFNIGIGNYRTSTLCKLVNANAWAQVKTELLKWDHSNGTVVPGLLRRREAESALIPS
jgi:lysozyme